MIFYRVQSQRRQLGLSLIELMISMTLGLLLVSGVLTVFIGSQKTADFNTALSGLQESARFAMNSMIRDARMAGHQGCIDVQDSAAMIRADSAPTDNYFNSAVTSSKVVSDITWTPEPPIGFTIPTDVGAPIPGTHSLSLQFGSPEMYTMQPMPNVGSPVVLDREDTGLEVGDLALISNCQVADIFEITGANDATLQHAASGNSNDNRLSAPYGTSGPLNRARVMRFEANIYFIGDTGRTNEEGEAITALFRQSLPYTNPPTEMVEGVSNMKIRLGFRDPDVGPDLTFVAPENSAAAVGQVEVVQIGFLMQSFAEVVDDDDTRTYFLAGFPVDPTSGTPDLDSQYQTDRRLRLAYNSTVSIRNR